MTRSLAVKIGGWIALLPLVFLTAICLIKYAVWSAVVSGGSGLSSQQALLTHAKRLAHLWVSGLATAEITATILLFALLPARLRLFRLIVPVLAIPIMAGAIAYILVTIGQHAH
ncbi:MAG: hypothetical protein WBW84_09535 [Acidobacteriaceae bacterium]